MILQDNMILKYALFTVIVSFVPLIIILRDITSTDKIWNLISEYSTCFNFKKYSDILSSGIFTFYTSYNSNKLLKNDESETLFTKKMLQRFTGKVEKDLYLAILGNVFDVSKAAKYYGLGETYHVFTGRDGSRAFVTGDFTETGLTDDVIDLSLQELRSLNDWLKFYMREYKYKGKLIGRYYDKNGNPTAYSHKLQLRMEEAERDQQDKIRYKMLFPPCNVEWTPEQGSRVWCSERSGGVERNWVGVPRKLYEPGAETYRCACINTLEVPQVISPETGKVRSGNLEEYDDCHPKSTSCYIKK